MPTVPVVDLARRAAALEPELSAAIAEVLAAGVFLLGPQTAAFEDEFAAFCGRRHAVAVASGTEASAPGAGGDGDGPRRRGDRPRDDRGAHRGGRRGRRRGARVRRRRPGHRRPRPRRGRRGRDRPHPGRDPRPPLRAPRRAARSRGPDPGGRRPGPRRARSRGPERRRGVFLLSHKNLGGIGDGGAVVTDDDDLAALLRELRNHARGADYDHPVRHRELPPVGDRGGGAARSGCAGSRPTTPAGREVAAAYRAAAPDLAWHPDHPRHVYHLCVARMPDRDAWRRARPFDTGDPLRAGAHPAARATASSSGRPAQKPRRGPRSPYRCPAFPRSPTTRSRQCVADSSEPGGRRRSPRSSLATTTRRPSRRW